MGFHQIALDLKWFIPYIKWLNPDKSGYILFNPMVPE
jgi:hypothetical protein